MPNRSLISLRIASDQGVQIRRMNQRRDSLEDIFLRAMENETERAANGSL